MIINFLLDYIVKWMVIQLGFKVEPGYFYIVPKGDNGQEYEYHIHCKEHVIYVKVYHNSNKKKLFEGNVIEFYDWVNSQ